MIVIALSISVGLNVLLIAAGFVICVLSNHRIKHGSDLR